LNRGDGIWMNTGKAKIRLAGTRVER